MRVEDREEVLQTARVPVGGQLERAAVRGDGSAQRIAPPQLAPVGRERVLDLFERGEDGLLILEERLFLPRLLHPDVRSDASAREDRPAEAEPGAPELAGGVEVTQVVAAAAEAA